MNIRLLSSAALVSLAAACGGEPKPAESPDGITETSAKEDMPPPPAKEAETPPPAEETEPGSGPAGGMIKVAAMKFTPLKKGKTDPGVELKADGTIVIGGKPAATIKGDQVDSTGGTSMLTVGVDGSLVGNGVAPGFKFEGDDLVSENGTKLEVTDDGTIRATTKDGKTEDVAKAEGGAAAKRAALIVTVLWLSDDEAAKPAGKDKKAAKPAKK